MKIQSTQNDVTLSQNITSSKFRIAQTKHTFQILSSGLYSDKITAIIRELSCNAYDSHVVAGCPERPFEVHFPNQHVNTFRIRDYGTGLSHEDVMGLYTTYMESTKQASNDQVGCFGLGSKSPFAYTDSFTVCSYFEGKKSTYNLFIGDEGVPECVRMSVVDTD